MEVFDKKVNLTVEEAMEVVKKKITESISGECIDAYQIQENTGSCYVAVFEKYYYRAKNRLTFTVVIDDFSGTTRVHGVGGGGSSGAFFRFDWGAADSFATGIAAALRPYEIGE